jgi:pyruvate dehydrogenase E2 component (dihydrolipoamide acetyltransferase)
MQEIKLPQLGQSVEEASIVQWFKQEGDPVSKGDVLFSVQTDKAEIDCESTADGVLRKILLEPGPEVPVMTVVALVGDADEELPDLSQYAAGDGGAEAAEAAPQPAAPEAKAEAPPASAGMTSAPRPSTPPTEQPAPAGAAGAISPRALRKARELGVDPSQAQGSGAGGRVMEKDIVALAEAGAPAEKATPTARRVAENLGVDLATVQGTGVGGKITKEDVEQAAQAPAEAAAPAARAAQPAATPARSAPPAGEVRRVPLTPMRRIIAERMCESVYTAPHYFVTIEVDMTAAKAYRAGHPERLSYNDLTLRATARALQDFPQVNARWAGDAIEEQGDINLGFAVALPTGLVVPVVKECQKKSVLEISRAARELIKKAKDNKLTPDDYTGNTFTVSNLGGFGIDHFTAIINQPDSAILAVGQMKDSVVVVDGGIQVRPIMKMTLSSDHRVIDGALAAQFMGRLRDIMEAGDF